MRALVYAFSANQLIHAELFKAKPMGILFAFPVVIESFLFNSTLQFNPLMASAGHVCLHVMHFPQLDSSIGVPQSNGASVRTEINLRAEPYFPVTNSADFPIQPRPARVAMVL